VVKLRRELEADYDPGTGGPVPGTGGPVDFVGTGVKLNYNQDDIDGTLIKQGDQLLSPLQRDGTAMPLPMTATGL
jgi:hypothetical protein